MKAIVIDRYGDNSVVHLADIPRPEIAANEVLVAVHATSINPVDFKTRDGSLKVLGKVKFPLILGKDFSGVVTAVGDQVTKFRVGDSVFARQGRERDGTFCEYVAIADRYLAHKPDQLTHEEAASLALVGLTAWQALTEVTAVQPNEKVFIHAGSGGVGSVAIQLAKHLGAHVATTTSTANIDLVRSLGADEVIDYRKHKFSQILENYDVVFDTLGGNERAEAFEILRRGGRMVSISGTVTTKFAREQNLAWPIAIIGGLLNLPTTVRAKRRGVAFTYLLMHATGTQLEYLASLVRDGKLRALIDKTFPLEQATEALAYVETGRTRGKVVLTVGAS